MKTPRFILALTAFTILALPLTAKAYSGFASVKALKAATPAESAKNNPPDNHGQTVANNQPSNPNARAHVPSDVPNHPVFDGEEPAEAPVPEPTSMLLMLSGLAGLAGYRKLKS